MRHPRDENPKQAALRAAFPAPPPRRKTMFLAGLPPLPPARCGAWGLLAVQLRYIRPRVWLAGVGGALGCLALGALPGWGADKAWALSALAPLVLLIAVAEFGRAGPCGMAELEAACRYDARQRTLARGLLVGAAQLPVLAAAVAVTGRLWGALPAALYLLAPYLLAAWLCLRLLETRRGPEGLYACAAICGAVAAARLLLELADLPLYAPRAVAVWGLAALAGAALAIRAGRRLLAAAPAPTERSFAG